MKKYVKDLNEFFQHVYEEENTAPGEEEDSKKSPEEIEDEEEEDAEDLEKDYDVFKVEEAGVHLDFYNEIIDNLTDKLGLKYEGPYSFQTDTVAQLDEKTPLNLEDWNSVYFKVYSEANDNPPLFLEGITDPSALEEYMDENGIHWPRIFIYKEENGDFKMENKITAEETDLLNSLKKEFD